VTWPRLFETSFAALQTRHLALGVLGESGWLKAFRPGGYDPGGLGGQNRRLCRKYCSRIN
jgi:hypothetical protein